MQTYGGGSNPIVTGWKYINCPPYSPEFNPTERLWQHTRKNGTHNRYFANEAELVGTLTRVFGEMQSHPELICSYLHPFC